MIRIHHDVQLEHLSAGVGLEGLPVDVGRAVLVAAFVSILHAQTQMGPHPKENDRVTCLVRYAVAIFWNAHRGVLQECFDFKRRCNEKDVARTAGGSAALAARQKT